MPSPTVTIIPGFAVEYIDFISDLVADCSIREQWLISYSVARMHYIARVNL